MELMKNASNASMPAIYRAAELKAHLFKGGMKASSFLSTAGSARGAT